MTAVGDPLREQYRDGANLAARIGLHERFSTNRLGLHPWLLAQMDLPPQAALLELGSGIGSFWITNRAHIPPGWRITLTDASPGMVREASARLEGHRSAFAFVVAPAEELPYPGQSFDAAIAHFMLYHVRDRPRAIREIARVLRPTGSLYAATNGARHMHEAWTLAMRAGLMTPAMVAAGDATAFSLENGAEQLRAEFPDVELRRYEDGRAVTEAEPLLA
ncbi:MAG: class I SAM-dependent methyltransferase, partial [Thermomicrobiales bacterium]|nr:class I SAM-dependent methyltransferase [Thermomicrobiales bacterium]